MDKSSNISLQETRREPRLEHLLGDDGVSIMVSLNNSAISRVCQCVLNIAVPSLLYY